MDINNLERDIAQGNVAYGKHKILKFVEDKAQRDIISKSQPFRNLMFSNSHDKWNKFEDVGAVMDSIWNLPDEATNLDWEEYYFNNVRTYGQINYLIEKMARAEKISYSTAVNYWWIYILDNAYKGWKNEQLAKDFIKQYIVAVGKPYTVRHASKEVDRKMSVDLEVLDENGELVCGAQVKEEGYFHSTRESVVNARTWNKRNYKKYTDAFGKRVWEINITETIKQNKLSWQSVEY